MPLALRRGRVASVEADGGGTIALTVDVDGERRAAVGYRALTGSVEPGDDVVVNVSAVALDLGSGGFDVVHVNLTRGLEMEGAVSPGRALKLNYTSLQHPVEPLEPAEEQHRPPRELGLAPVAVLALHGQLAPCAWTASAARPNARIGYVQSEGGALPGALSSTVSELRRRGLVADHVTDGAAFGGEREAITVGGALEAGFGALGWDAAVVGPGPGIVGSESALGHGGLAALETAHACLALGARPILVPRLSSGDPRPRHRGVSHHTATVLDLVLREIDVALPLEAQDGLGRAESLARHRVRRAATDVEGYRSQGLPAHTMGRSLDDDELFFRAALAGGAVLAEELARV